MQFDHFESVTLEMILNDSLKIAAIDRETTFVRKASLKLDSRFNDLFRWVVVSVDQEHPV